MKAKRKREMIIETLERITIRLRRGSQRAYCSSCGRSTTWLTEDQIREMFGAEPRRLSTIHLTDDGPVRLICADSIDTSDTQHDEKENEK